MKKITIVLFLFAVVFSCSDNEEDINYDKDFRQEMRNFVVGISEYAKEINPDFIIIPQNGQELVTMDGEETETPCLFYLSAIDGVGREDLFYGYDNDDISTPASEKNYMVTFLDVCENNNVEVLTTDYCWTHSKMDDSYTQNNSKNYISFAAPERELNIIPDYPEVVYNENNNNIYFLADAKNFLYLINPENFTTKQNFINAITATNYDVLIMDCFFNNDLFTADEVTQLKAKQNGAQRLVISYMSIGEAENYRYYWQSTWEIGNPSWLKSENPDWEGNYKVLYWEQEWQTIIYGNNESYLKKILDAGFDGVYLDIIDAFEYFE
ncbi:MAG: endo alpha-1,4 polygalactosaminidase [Bacteroidales bacterium]